MDIADYTLENGIGLITIDSPPVNALGHAVRLGLDEGVRRFVDDPATRAIVIICAGRTFFAGADITEFDKPIATPTLHELFLRIEASPKPVIAAIYGTALGGGFELSLACHFRIAAPSAKAGLPEVHLGLLPGAGGTQRLPRMVGAERALDMIISGKPLSATKALELGLIDELAAEESLRTDAIAFAARVADLGQLPLVRHRDDMIADASQAAATIEAFVKKNMRSFRGFKAPGHIVQSVRNAIELPFDEGLTREWDLFLDLQKSSESQAQRYVFFAERETSKVGLPRDTPLLPIASVGVIGAGTMGGGIAMNFLNTGIAVTLVELKADALDRGIALIRRNYEAAVKKGRMTQDQVEQRMALIRPALSLDALADVDLVIEAVFESMDVKKEVFGNLDRICKQGTILASNTSFLNLDEIAAAISRPEWAIGLHFFSPANVMRLLEVVRGRMTSPEVIATAMNLGGKIGKLPILAGVCHGFIANRLMEPYMKNGDALALEGPTPTEIDKAIFDYGFAMGPFQMIDLVGLDVIGRDSTERTLSGDLVARGRLGQKSGGGFYDYDDRRKATPSPVATEVIAELSRLKGVTARRSQPAEAIVARLLYPVLNEGAKILEGGIALRASDIDVAAILGYNWPVYTGGPMFWADTVGLPKIVEGLRMMGIEPAVSLVKLAASGGRLAHK